MATSKPAHLASYSLLIYLKIMRAIFLLPLFLAVCAASSIRESDLDWWETTIFYQIYPRSFADSNGDGIGDLNGE